MGQNKATVVIFGLDVTTSELIFSAGAVVSGLLAILLIRVVIYRRMRGRLTRLTRVEQFDAVSTETPFASSLPVARDEARQSVEKRYGVIRRIATGLLVVLMLIGATFPMLDALPRAALSLAAAIAAAVLGIAAKPFVENLISGVVISFSSQFKIGDTIILDEKYYATVEDITITHTVLKLWDWKRHVIPNSVMLQKDFSNLTHKDSYIWAYIEFQLAYGTDFGLVEELAVDAATSSEHFSGFERPQVWFRDLKPGTVNVWLAAWAKNPDAAWYLRSEMRRGLAERFAHHGIRSQVQHVELMDPTSRSQDRTGTI